MSAPTQWGAATVLVRCKRCGKAGKARRAEVYADRGGPRDVFCSRQCQEWHDEEIRLGQLDRQNARRHIAEWERREELRTTPLHVLYPEMIAVMAAVQAQRPSYCAWLGCLDDDAAEGQ